MRYQHLLTPLSVLNRDEVSSYMKKVNYVLFCISVLVFSGISTMTKAQPNIAQHTKAADDQISAHWNKGEFSSFQGVDDIRINYASFVNESHQQCIVIVPGRSEGYLKYKELSYELFQHGYDIHIIDHRGQGISERIASNRYKGYVKSFDHYSDDLHTFISQVTKQQCKNTYLLAHSMGGAISARYLQRYPNDIKAAVLASPMIAINSGGIPAWLASTIINAGDMLNRFVSDQPWYFLGQSDYQPGNFESNHLTHSEQRYQVFNQLYQQTPELQLGGVTFTWLAQALQANNDIFGHIHALTTPTIVLQSGGDTIVDNQAQDDFCQALHQAHPASCAEGKPILIETAYHELFFEVDEYRKPAVEAVLSWFNQH